MSQNTKPMLLPFNKKGTRMNANELAEIQAFKTEELTMWERNHTATMLRQQQAEIKELKAKLQLHDAMDNQCASLIQQFRKA